MTKRPKDYGHKKKKQPGRLLRLQTWLRARTERAWYYWTDGIWQDTRTTFKVNLLKTLNISINSFLDTNLQNKACALSFRTTLAIVPAIAMLFAIGRGFGFQKLLEQEIERALPGQHNTLEYLLKFSDSYLSHSSEGLFVGIGIVFLVWMLISLLSNVEQTFNLIWGIKQNRGFWRKITDYTAMLLILPILMICGGGIAVFMSSTLQSVFHFSFMTPVISALLEVASWMFTWLFFAGAFILVPNTKVKIPNALLAGVLTGTAFLILQWLFVSGQLYVTRYNAIYGSFAFLPLLMLWLQLTWMAVLGGALICYSSQNIFMYAFSTQVSNISHSYLRKVEIAVATIIVERFVKSQIPLTRHQLAALTEIPPRLLSDVLDHLMRAGIINRMVLDIRKESYGYQPAVEPSLLTVGYVRSRLNNLGKDNFIPRFDDRFGSVVKAMDSLSEQFNKAADAVPLTSLKIDPAGFVDAETAESLGIELAREIADGESSNTDNDDTPPDPFM